MIKLVSHNILKAPHLNKRNVQYLQIWETPPNQPFIKVIGSPETKPKVANDFKATLSKPFQSG